MKNHYLNKGSGGSGQGCFDSSKNTQPQFVFSGDLGPEGGFQHKPDFWPTGIDSTTTRKTTPTCKTFVQQQQQQQQQQQKPQEQEQSQVTESKRMVLVLCLFDSVTWLCSCSCSCSSCCCCCCCFWVALESIPVGQKSGLCWTPLPGQNRH